MEELAALFEPRSFLFGGEDAELRAVAAGRKALAWYPMNREQAEERTDLDEFVEAARELGLSILVVPRQEEVVHPKAPDRDVFIFKEAASWRVEAFRVARDMPGNYQWSDSSEYMSSVFLGYAPEDCERWIERCRYNRLGWRGQTVLGLCDAAQLEELRELAFRCFPTTFDTAGFVVFGPADTLVLRRNLGDLIPDGRSLVRFAVENESFRRIFWNVSAVAGVRSAPLGMNPAAVNAALESHIELWTSEGWTCRPG